MNSYLKNQTLFNVAALFDRTENILSIQELTSGIINNTFLVKLKSNEYQEDFILQKINNTVFPNPQSIISNWILISKHIEKELLDNPTFLENRRWEVPHIIRTSNSKLNYIELYDSYWRAIKYIDLSKTLNTINNVQQAKEVGFALAFFHRLINDFSLNKLYNKNPGLHDTLYCISQYDLSLEACKTKSTLPSSLYKKVDDLNEYIISNRSIISFLNYAIERDEFVFRPIHGDPKISNFLFDLNTNRVISMIDFDTIQTGIIQYDIADCLRSCCNIVGEEPDDICSVNFDLTLCEAILENYILVSRPYLSKADYYYLPYFIKLIPFELGIRFLTDYLKGNSYFKVEYKHQNLYRAEVQFCLVASIEKQWESIVEMINRIEGIS